MAQLSLLNLPTNSNIDDSILDEFKCLIDKLETYPLDLKIEIINNIKLLLHNVSPFSNEPVDCVLWIHNNYISANDYNPNNVAPPEMKLLERSIQKDGYTQPIVAWKDDNKYEVVDGFHRNRVGRESIQINQRIYNYLPITIIKHDQSGRNDRIAATIRHNRARGKHQVDKMSDIVCELKKRNWSDEKIGKELGMDADEVLRLCQISGLIDMFSDEDFSMSWDAAIFEEDDIEGDILTDEEDISHLG